MQWYETDEGEKRLILEIKLLQIDFPQLKLDFLYKDGTAIVSGWIFPNDMLRERHYIEARYPYYYGNGSRIKVYAPYEYFPPYTPHRYPDGELCLQHNDFNAIDNITTVIGWASQWFVLFESFKVSGKW